MSELYELPNGWEWKTFEDKLVLIQNGLSDTQNDDGIGYPISRIETIQNETIDSNRIKYIDTNDNSIIEKYRYDYGDLLFSHINSFEKVGKVCLYTNQIENLLHGVNLLRMKFTDDINSKFVFYYLISNVSRRFYEPNIKKAINQASINQKNIKSIPLPFPPLSEQQRIVSKLDLLFEKIDKSISLHQKNMDEADVFMGSVLNEVFGELEEKYEKIIFDKVCNKITDGSHNPPKGIENSEYLMLSSKNVIDNTINFEAPRYLTENDFISENKRTDVMIGDVLLTIVGTIGRTAVVETDKKFVLQRSVAVLKPKNDVLNSYFLMYSLRKNLDFLMDSAKGAAQKGIYLKSVKQLEIVNVPLQIQQKVVKYLDEISKKIEKVKSVQKEKMDSLKALKASILDKAFRGEL